MERAKPKESSTKVPRPKKKFKNYIGEVYKNVINGLIGPLEEEFRKAGCSSQTLYLICDIWFDKVKASKAVDNFLSPDLRRRGSLSAAERAEAVAKRDMAVAQERMACSKFLLVGDDPKTKPAITSEGTIVEVPCNKEENDSDKNSSVTPDTGEWEFPPDIGSLDPKHLVFVTLKVPLRTHVHREIRSRHFKLRMPASYIQQKKLDSMLNKSLVKQLSELPAAAANACIQYHLQSFMTSEKYPPRPMKLIKQLDGSPDDNSDEYMEFVQTSRIFKRLYGKDKDWDSASNSSRDDDDQEDCTADDDTDNDDVEQNNQRNNKKICRKSKEYLKKLFYLCSDSSSQSSSDDNSVFSDQSEDTDIENYDDDDDDDDESDNDEREDNNDKDKDKNNKDKTKTRKFLSKSTGNRNSSGHKDMNKKKASDSIKSNDKNDKPIKDPPKKKLKIETSACPASQLQNSKNSELNNSEDDGDISESFENDIDGDMEDDQPDYEPLNSDDDLESLDSTDETDNVCICLYNIVKRTKKNWRIELRSGIMNVSGEDYAFNTANIVTKW